MHWCFYQCIPPLSLSAAAARVGKYLSKKFRESPLVWSLSTPGFVLKCLSVCKHTPTRVPSTVWSEFVLIQAAITSVSFPVGHLSHRLQPKCDTQVCVCALPLPPSLSLDISPYITLYLSPLFCAAILVFYPLIVSLPSFLPLPLLCSTLLLLHPPLCLYVSTLCLPPLLSLPPPPLFFSLSLSLVSLTKQGTAATAVAAVAHSSQFWDTAAAAVCMSICVCVCVSRFTCLCQPVCLLLFKEWIQRIHGVTLTKGLEGDM